MRLVWIYAGWLAFTAGAALGQTAFDVASITPTPVDRARGEGGGWERISWTPTRLSLENASLSVCIQWAWEVKFYQISGPAWIGDERYDILAKTEHPAEVARLRLMLQALLAERFRLTLHRETRTMPVFELTVTRGGSRLAVAEEASKAEIRVSNGKFVFRHTSMPELAERLSHLAGVERPVVDRTGLAGAYDFSLPAIPHLPEDGEATWLFPALEKELGLALTPTRAAIEILAIDHVEKPTAN